MNATFAQGYPMSLEAIGRYETCHEEQLQESAWPRRSRALPATR